MSVPEFRLYGSGTCHLCDEAEATLRRMGLAADYIDITGDAELLERYGTRIPVLRRMDSGAELGWPFDAAAISRFLGS
jgi:glutaredoxin-related protein